MTRFAASAVRNWRGAGFSPVSYMNYDAKAQQEAFVQLEKAGRRVPVVFSHVLLTYSNNNNTRKGAFNQLSHSAHGGTTVRRDSNNSTKEAANSLPESGRPASIASKKSTNNSFFTFSTNHN